MSSPRRKKRVKKVHSCPNPLFVQWLKEWRDEAREKGWKTHHTYSKALKSLSVYPLVLKSGKEAKILEYFGDRICNMLDKKLADHNPSDSTDESVGGSQNEQCTQSGPQSRIEEIINDKRKRSRTTVAGYCPRPNSGPFAILITLLKKHQDGFSSVKKQSIIDDAQVLCSSSFTVPLPGSHYTAWSSMGILIKRQLVSKVSNPARYSLTDAGLELSEALEKANTSPSKDGAGDECSAADEIVVLENDELPTTANNMRQCGNNRCFEKVQSESETYFNVSEGENQDSEMISIEPNRINGDCANQLYLKGGTYDICLIVDVAETNSSLGIGAKNSKSALIPELRQNGVNFEVRKLNVGDFAWIAKEKVDPIPGCLQVKPAKELILDFIIERKRMDDLASSIKDGRFHEQKYRLMNSGLHKPIYLVENYNGNCHLGLPESSLKQAIANTQVINGFCVRCVNDSKESVAYLTIMTRHLVKLYQNCDLYLCADNSSFDGNQPNCNLKSFNEFNSMSVKNKQMSVTGMFLKLLMKIGGMSPDKAVAIVQQYPTVSHLLKGYSLCESDKEKELLLAKIKFGSSQRHMGPSLSRIIHLLFCSQSWP